MWLKSKYVLWFLIGMLVISPSNTVTADTPLINTVLIPGAEDSKPKCWPLDVVVLIDQSASMSGTNGNNDPKGYRFDAAREVLDQLARNRQEGCDKAVHRISVITFGDSAEVHLWLSPIVLGKNDNPADSLKDYFDAIDLAQARRSQSYTNFVNAFGSAEEVFNHATSATDDPKDYGPRRQIVILITDGKPTDSGEGSNQETLTCNLKSELDKPFWSSKSIWIVALNASRNAEGKLYLDENGCSPNLIRQDLDQIASSHHGKLNALPFYNEQTIPTALGDIVSAEFGQTSEPVSCSDVIYVDPYLQKVEFRFYKNTNEQNSHVTLSKLDDDTHKPIFTLKEGNIVEPKGDIGNMKFDPKNYSTTSGIGKEYSRETYSIDNPLPGAWSYQVEGMDPDVCRRQIEGRKINFFAEASLDLDGILPQVTDKPYYDTKNPVNFVVSLRNQDTSQLITSNPKYPLEITINWKPKSGNSTLPDGSPIKSIPLSAIEEGKWGNKDFPVLTPEIGTYTLEIVVVTPRGDPAQPPVEVLREIRSFEVKPLDRLEFSVVSPTGEVQACNQVKDGKSITKPIKIKVQLHDKDGNPITNPQDFISDTSQAFKAKLIDANATPYETYLSLESGSNGVFTGNLFESAQGLIGCGHSTLSVEFVGSYDVNKFALLKKNVEIPLERVEAQGVVANVISPSSGSNVSRFSGILSACSVEEITPVYIQVELMDLSGKQLLDPRTLSVSQDAVLYQALLQGPLPDQTEIIKLIPQKTSKGYILVGTGGTSLSDEGSYQVTITPVDGSFASNYTWTQDEIQIQFTRQDGLLTNQTACKVAWGGIYFLWAILAILFGIAVTGGPGGSIQFMDDRGDELKKWPLSSMQIMSFLKYRAPALSDAGIKYAQFYRGAVGKDTRAVRVKLVDKDDSVLWDMEIPANQDQPVAPGVSARYYHAKHKDQD